MDMNSNIISQIIEKLPGFLGTLTATVIGGIIIFIITIRYKYIKGVLLSFDENEKILTNLLEELKTNKKRLDEYKKGIPETLIMNQWNKYYDKLYFMEEVKRDLFNKVYDLIRRMIEDKVSRDSLPLDKHPARLACSESYDGRKKLLDEIMPECIEALKKAITDNNTARINKKEKLKRHFIDRFLIRIIDNS